MAGLEEPAYFANARAIGRAVVREPPKFDLDAYIANYKGKTRIDRLYLIGTTSSYLYLEALKAAIAEAKRGKDVGRYESAVAALREIAPADPDAKLDQVWVTKTQKQVQAETERLEQELRGYKNNLIKESIRMGYDDLGQHCHRIGDLANATKAFARMREYCTTPSHVAIMALRIIHVSVDQSNWLAVQSNALKIRNQTQRPQDSERYAAKLSAVIGLAQLESGNYKDAAISFLGTDPRMLGAKLNDPNDDEAYNEVLTPNDVAVYGGLCALASMTRQELQSRVLDNSSFRNYLELEPHIRRAISHFVSSKYSACLSILESYRPDYLLDIHLQRHVPELYFQVRTKAIVQYFIPFSCVTLSALAKAFHTSEENVEGELVDMIQRGMLQARLDLEQRVLVADVEDVRQRVHEEALAMSKAYARTCQLRLVRMGVIASSLEVKQTRKGGRGGSHADYGGYGGDLLSGSGDLLNGSEGMSSGMGMSMGMGTGKGKGMLRSGGMHL